MPWRKYTSRKGKFGPIYHIQNGIQVRLNSQKKWILFIEIDGKRKNKTIGSGREGLVKAIKAAEAISSQLEPKATLNTWSQAQQVQQGSHLNQDVPKFLDYSKRWLENNAGRWDEQTYERYEGILRLHIWPNQAFQDKTLDEINRNTIKNFLRGFLNIRSAKSVELAQIILYGIFDEAIDDEIVEANPASRVLKKVLPVDKNQRKVNEAEPFNLEERDLFIETACKTSTCTWAEQLILKVMAFVGFRLGEALAMRFENFDFHSMSYHITQSYKLHKFRKPKKGKKRFVDLADFLADEFQQYVFHLKKENLKNGKGGNVDRLFVDPKEKGDFPFSQRKIQALMKKVCKKAGLRARNPHDLRHTYASILLMSGTSPAYVQKQLGHESISITCDVYGHWIPGKGREGLENALQGFVRDSHISAYPIKKASVIN